MYWFIGVGIKNSIDIIVEATAVNTTEFTFLQSCHSSSEDVDVGFSFCSPLFLKVNFIQFLYNRIFFINKHKLLQVQLTWLPPECKLQWNTAGHGMVTHHTDLAMAPFRMVTHLSFNWDGDCLTSVTNHEMVTPSYQGSK